MIKICLNCGREFEPYVQNIKNRENRQKFCCDKCNQKYHKIKYISEGYFRNWYKLNSVKILANRKKNKT